MAKQHDQEDVNHSIVPPTHLAGPGAQTLKASVCKRRSQNWLAPVPWPAKPQSSNAHPALNRFVFFRVASSSACPTYNTPWCHIAGNVRLLHTALLKKVPSGQFGIHTGLPRGFATVKTARQRCCSQRCCSVWTSGRRPDKGTRMAAMSLLTGLLRIAFRF